MANQKQVTLVLAHPDDNSLNHAVGQSVKKGIEENGSIVHLHDLYKENFYPVLNNEDLNRKFSVSEKVLAYQEDIEFSNGIILVFPDWWGQPPAILKGWFDRVLTQGVAFDYRENPEGSAHVPLLSHMFAMIICTTHSKENKIGPLRTLLKMNVFDFCGIKDYTWCCLPEVRNTRPIHRNRWISETTEKAVDLMKKD